MLAQTDTAIIILFSRFLQGRSGRSGPRPWLSSFDDEAVHVMAATSDRVDAILKCYGTTYAQQPGIRLADKPAAHELFKSGFCTPQHMADATWQQRAEALRRDHYRRYGKREPPCSAMAPSFCESAIAATYASYAIAPTQSTNSACF